MSIVPAERAGSSPHRAVAALAAAQRGRVSRRQLLDAGLSASAISRRIDDGRLHRVHAGVYAVGHAMPVLLADETAALLACGDDAVLGGRSGSAMHDLVRRPRVVEVLVPGRRRERPGIVVRGTSALPDADVVVVDGLRCISVPRALADIAGIERERTVMDALLQALRIGVFDRGALEEVMARDPRSRGRARLRQLLAELPDAAPDLRGDAEPVLRHALRERGVPLPATNVVVHGWTVDAYWHRYGFVLEIDGWTTHDTKRSFLDDRRMDNELAEVGIEVRRLPAIDVLADIGGAVDVVRSALRRKGWRG